MLDSLSHLDVLLPYAVPETNSQGTYKTVQALLPLYLVIFCSIDTTL